MNKPLGSPLNSTQIHFKITLFGTGTKKLCTVKITHSGLTTVALNIRT